MLKWKGERVRLLVGKKEKQKEVQCLSNWSLGPSFLDSYSEFIIH